MNPIRRRSLLALVTALTFLSACGPPMSAPLSVVDHQDPLTSAPKDNLFTLSLGASGDTYELAELLVSAGMAGGTATAVNFTLNDLNADGKWGPGESLSCVEPPVNMFDASVVSKSVNVDVAIRGSGSAYISVGHATWTPTN